MTRSRLLLLAAFLLPALAPAALAQGQGTRIGFTDYELIIVQMPQYRTVQEQLQAQAQTDQQALAEMEQNIQTRFTEYQEQRGVLSNEARQTREQEIVDMQTNLQQEQQRRLQALGRREAELLQPLLDQLQNAIDAVAQARGLTVVLSSRVSTEPVILYASPDAIDITAEVMSRLGISMTQSEDGQ